MNHLIALNEQEWATASWPLGTHPSADGVTFAVHAPAASRIQLEIYPEALGADATDSFLMAKGVDGIWRAKVQGLQLGALVGFRAWGDNWPYVEGWEPGSDLGFVADLDEDGNRFNPNKVLFDPYAREVTHNVYTDLLHEYGVNDGVFGTGGEIVDGVPRRQIDTGRYAPKGIVIAEDTYVSPKPQIPGEKSVIYEVQVEQLTGHPSASRLTELLADEPGFADVVDIPEEYRGTYKGVGMMAPYLKAIGMTTIELLPIHETNASETGRPGASNAWGYMTLTFFAPNRQYSSDKSWGGPTREFKEMVSAFHDAGLQVYLDVVYNHTAEGGNWNGDVNTTGFTSLGGFATAEYYQMTTDKILVDGATGTSNQLNFSSEAAQRLVLDSVKYWTQDMQVDGFRFDLATVLGRKPDEAHPEDWAKQKRFFTDHPLLVAIADFAAEEGIEVIAEAWDLWGYEVGNFPRGWGEWNGRYRDAIRRYAKGDGNTIDFLDMMNGDYHHFHDSGGAQKTINFIDAHDGFNMVDLVSYQEKNNDQPFPFGPSDGGSDNNLSWDSGGSQALRRQRVRNFWTMLFFSRGVPMIVAGDEFGRTQNGNNNPWALDSVAMRNNYAMIPTNSPHLVPVADGLDAVYHDNLGTFETPANVNGLFRFATFLANLRQRHEALQQKSWGDLIPDNRDVSYLFHTPTREGFPEEGHRAVAIYINSPGDNFWVMVNMTEAPIDFVVPPAQDGLVWRRLVDTANWAEPACNFWREGEGMIVADGVTVEPWSIVVWHELPAPDGSRKIPVWKD
ncbi:alpha-amylase family glycosyl hydrolase [Tessaracoccus flavus]|uniref:Glycogen debranching enzyme n=1 Tax=Tessaracoccus flavus TaxID=1610493 RepID=A0A1Q2CI83_9ACTN|nr:alpha-amylase family glycosyl hydrolase [Tessaracoccus flavus]AQP45836.1 glycogen debranching enzyme [Tessaracoccus flavus]SDZ15074.1 glycogen operon protein [Tessaracoccus flavus]